ncbi:phosphatidylinositol mannoside acyltransferase [Salinispora arenicola]|uniref:KDO2-lipid IV(A) lauroyltransferase n=1 Tax=Salinispora arenicola TaxID=168697 RepID=A0A542XTZ4_SALAC|nr:phosphatidylinositol mannoside acyltransferase [Salinispora arenicola]MCN0178781.1 phosphatidylinositol mannoside acyltransferase [Salinispora arenicola]TQL39315.1 KDO2-lipid IV(A) lauroyltransferase [Salinispora arenicola]GIM87768.1 lipid A biosynthesis lauroyl acyltransferase [Salinispora arenicola]
MNLTELAYLAGWRGVRALPRSVAGTLFRVGADRAHRRGGGSTTRLRANLRRVVGPDVSEADLDVLVRAGLRSYARYWMEAFRLPALSRAEILAGFRFDREDVLAADVAAGRGAIVALPHSGNWDMAGAWVAAMGWPIATVAERLKPEGIYQRFLAFRRDLGMEILPTHGGERPAFDVLVDRVKAGYVVPLLADRDLSARGVTVDFFGSRTRMPPGPALLALRTGAPLYVASLWYEPDAACATIEGPLALPGAEQGTLDVRVRILAQRVADGLAAGIARHPQDWHMLQRMWLDQRATPTGAGRPSPTTGQV